MDANARARPAPRATLDGERRRWERELTSALDVPVVVHFNRARREPVRWSWDAPPRHVALRLHEVFAEAPHEVREAMAAWIRAGRRARQASARLDRFIAERVATLPAPPRRSALCARGATHDLEGFAEGLLAVCFTADFGGSRSPPDVTWGRRGRSLSRGSLRLGSYDPAAHVVRVHPVLDRSAVPDWFVRYVLFHELLHAALPPRPGPDGRWILHGPDFRRRERAYPDYRRALAWEAANLGRLVRAARLARAPRIALEAAPADEPLERGAGVTRLLQGLFFEPAQ